MKTKAQKTQVKSFIDQNPVEAFKGMGETVLDSAFSDLAKDGISDLWNQLLGGEQKKAKSLGGELAEGEEIDLKSIKRDRDTEKLSSRDIEPALNYRREILDQGRAVTQENTHQLKIRIEEILVELKKITSTSQELVVEFKELAIEQRIEKPGDYHLNFFQWMLSLVKSARMKIEDSGAWLAAMGSKKSKRNYWTMFEKHGTTFGLSNERVIATQAG